MNTRKVFQAALFVMFFSVLLLATGGAFAGDPGAKKASASYQVKIADFSFQPMTLNVPVGATVTWTNKDEEPHTVFSTDNTFKSHALDTDERFSYTFKKAGTYKYFCSVHPKMVATVVVGSSSKEKPAAERKMGEMPMN